MRILIATGIYPPDVGGPANYAKELRDFFGQEHQVKVLSFSFYKRFPTGLRHVLYLFSALFHMLRSDVCVALDTFSVGLPAVVAGRLARKPVVIRTGGDFLWEQYVERTGGKILFSEFYLKERSMSSKEKMIFKLTGWTLKNATRIVFSTDYQRDVFIPAYKLKKGKILIIENSYPDFKVNKKIPHTKEFFCAVRDLKWKNLDSLREAFSKAKEKDPSLTLTLNSGISREEVLRRIQGAYATILVSLGDISPNFILESLSMKTPFVLTKETGLREKLKDVAVFADPLSVEDISDKILELAKPVVYQEKLKAMESFSLKRSYADVGKDFLKLFNNLLEGQR